MTSPQNEKNIALPVTRTPISGYLKVSTISEESSGGLELGDDWASLFCRTSNDDFITKVFASKRFFFFFSFTKVLCARKPQLKTKP